MATHEPEAKKFARLPKRGLLLGLTLSQLLVAAAGLVPFVLAIFAGNSTQVFIALGWAALCAVIVFVPVSSRKVIEWIPIVATFWWRRSVGQLAYRRRLTPRPAGTLALPGDAARLRYLHDDVTGAVMVHDPVAGTLSAVVTLTHPSFALLDPAEQQRRVAGWGRVLAGACRSKHVARVQVLEQSMPDAGTGLTDHFASEGHDDGSWAATVYRELIERAGPAGERHAAYIALAINLRTVRRGLLIGALGPAAEVLRAEMDALTTALRAADLRPGPLLMAGQLAVLLRSTYDPAMAQTLARYGDTGRDLALAGPLAIEETWGHVRSDTAYHAVLWITQWPQAHVYPGFLGPLIMTSGIARSFSLTIDPMRADQAAKNLRRKRTEHIADRAHRAKIGQIEDIAETEEYRDVLQQEADLTAGHGVVRYTGLIALSAATEDDLEEAVAQVQQFAIQAMCEVRRLVGRQAQALTIAALPLARPT